MFTTPYIFIVLQMLDVLTTAIYLKIPYIGVNGELNPIIRFIVNNLDPNQWMMGMWLFKASVIMCMYFALNTKFEKYIQYLNVGFLIIVISNLIAIYGA